MNKNYAVFPCRNVNITQNYKSAYSHATQSGSTNGVKSYPIDFAWGDTYLMAPCQMKSVKMNGFWNESVLNQVFFHSTEKVHCANGEYDYITILAGHTDDWDYSQDKIGTIYDRGVDMLNYGTDGGVSAHFDIVVAIGLQTGWVKNSFGEWVLPNSRKPEDIFYIDPKYNNLINTQGIDFKQIPIDAYLIIPTPVKENKDIDQVKVICGDNTLRVRQNGNANETFIGYATPGLYNIISTIQADGFTWYQVEDGKWFANAEGCTQFIPKYVAPVVVEPPIKEEKPNKPIEPPKNEDIKPIEEPKQEDNTNTTEKDNKPKKSIVATILGTGGAITYYLQEHWLMLLVVTFVILLVATILYIKKRRNK